MNKEQKENLKSLLKLPELASKHDTNFDMSAFFYDVEKGLFDSSLSSVEASDYNCGTSACLAGHLPLTTGIPKTSKEKWNDYIERVAGIRLDHDWDYLFSEEWSNDIDDAVTRVKTFIGNGYEAPLHYSY